MMSFVVWGLTVMPFRHADHIAAVSLWQSAYWQRPDHALHAKLPKSNSYQVNMQVSDCELLLLMPTFGRNKSTLCWFALQAWQQHIGMQKGLEADDLDYNSTWVLELELLSTLAISPAALQYLLSGLWSFAVPSQIDTPFAADASGEHADCVKTTTARSWDSVIGCESSLARA